MAAALRDTLYGDQPIEKWPSGSAPGKPWTLFVEAAEALRQGDQQRAIQFWKAVLDLPALEARHYAQAWTFLRQHGEQPAPEVAKTVYGVVAEVSMERGLDLLAAYADYSARYYNYSGAGIVWEHPDNRLDPQIDRLLAAGRQVVAVIGPWTEPRPGPPPVNQARISMLTPSGIYFGQGSFQGLSGDALGKLLVDSATDLMLHMTQLSTK